MVHRRNGSPRRTRRGHPGSSETCHYGVSRFQMGLVIASGLSIGTLFKLFVMPAVYLVVASEHHGEVAVAAAEASAPPAHAV